MKTPIELAEEYVKAKFSKESELLAAEQFDLYTESAKDDFLAGVEASQSKWISVKDDLPRCYRLGFWDGKKSDFVAGKDVNGKLHIACLYSGCMDGHEFNNFYDQNDYSVEIVEWCKIPE